MRGINETLNTNGSGAWSQEARAVKVTGLDFNDYSFVDIDEPTGMCKTGELRVFFDRKTWNPAKHGLIYTDGGFLQELREFLTRAGYDPEDIGYSEQGMQGDNYVSLDVGPKFIATWVRE